MALPSPSPSPSPAYDFMWAPSPSTISVASKNYHTSSPLPPVKTKTSTLNSFSPPLIALIAVIGTAFLIVLYAHFLSRQLRRIRRRYRRYRRRQRLLLSTTTATSSPASSSLPRFSNAFSFEPSTDYFFSPYGLDDSAIKSLPLSSFAAPNSSSAAAARDCAVCLLEFEDGDSLRTLPICTHSFHVDCIDVWLRSHATCPLCRSSVFEPPPLFLPMRAARIRPSLDDLIFAAADPDPEPEPEIQPVDLPSPLPDRDFLLKRSFSFGFERNLDASTGSPWRYHHQRHRGSFWSKRWPSPFSGGGGGGGGSSSTRAGRVSSSRSHRGFSFNFKSPFVKRRSGGGFFPLSESGAAVRFHGPSVRRSRAMTSPSSVFVRSMMVTGFGSSRMRCGDPEALLSP